MAGSTLSPPGRPVAKLWEAQASAALLRPVARFASLSGSEVMARWSPVRKTRLKCAVRAEPELAGADGSRFGRQTRRKTKAN